MVLFTLDTLRKKVTIQLPYPNPPYQAMIDQIKILYQHGLMATQMRGYIISYVITSPTTVSFDPKEYVYLPTRYIVTIYQLTMLTLIFNHLYITS